MPPHKRGLHAGACLAWLQLQRSRHMGGSAPSCRGRCLAPAPGVGLSLCSGSIGGAGSRCLSLPVRLSAVGVGSAAVRVGSRALSVRGSRVPRSAPAVRLVGRGGGSVGLWSLSPAGFYCLGFSGRVSLPGRCPGAWLSLHRSAFRLPWLQLDRSRGAASAGLA